MNRSTIKATQAGQVIVWPVSEIVYFRYANKYTIARNQDGRELLINDRLKNLVEEFADTFIQASRGVLVARNRIQRVVHEPCRIEGVVHVLGAGVELQCSRSRMKSIKALIAERKQDQA